MIAASLTLIVTAGFTANKLTATGAAEVAASSASSSSTAADSPRVSAPAKCPDHRAGLRFYRGRHAYWLDRRGVEIRTLQGREARSCSDARYLAVVWRGRAQQARKAFVSYIERITLDDFRVGPGMNAWLRAVEETQKPYPGTSGWLLSCSASEGGWGRWVPNSQGSGVGGWMQMYPSTFWRMFAAAKADVTNRGFLLPDSAASWYSPLGQALGSAWGLLNGRRGEWAGGGC